MLKTKLRSNHIAASLAAGLAAFVLIASSYAKAEQTPLKIAVFDFELTDKSASTTGQDKIDSENLKLATEEARRMLSASGRYKVIDGDGQLAKAGGFQSCNGCERQLAKTLGADRSMVGVFTRVSRTEYTLQILVRDADTGAVLSNDFTGLRMGANYSWPRGVKWLMKNKILTAQNAN